MPESVKSASGIAQRDAQRLRAIATSQESRNKPVLLVSITAALALAAAVWFVVSYTNAQTAQDKLAFERQRLIRISTSAQQLTQLKSQSVDYAQLYPPAPFFEAELRDLVESLHPERSPFTVGVKRTREGGLYTSPGLTRSDVEVSVREASIEQVLAFLDQVKRAQMPSGQPMTTLERVFVTEFQITPNHRAGTVRGTLQFTLYEAKRS